MKSILTILGTFLFGAFCEFFIRVVIIFYHQSAFTFYGVENLPGWQWILILMLGVFVSTWISSMLLLTITTFSPVSHLLALFSLFLIWRISEFFAMGESNLSYTITMIIVQGFAIILAYLTKQKMNATPNTD